MTKRPVQPHTPLDVHTAASASALSVPRWVVSLLAWGTRRWLALLTVLTVLYVGLSFLAPTAMRLGHEELAHRIYRLYSFTCHQLPASSFWLWGTDMPFRASVDEFSIPADYLAAREYVGNPTVGFKSGMCWRTLALYGSTAVFLLAYMGMHRRWKILPLWAGLILALPMAADGFSQLLGLRESNLYLRIVTGVLFSLSLVWALVPRVDAAMRHVAADLQGK